MASPSRPYTACTSAPLLPVVDVLLTAGYGALAVKAVSEDTATPGGLVLGGLLIGTLASSAIYGFWTGSRCDDLMELNALCMKGDRAACLALNPGYDPARPSRVPLLCAQDADCAPGQACLQSTCLERPAPAAPSPEPVPAPVRR